MRAAVLSAYSKTGRDLDLRDVPTPDVGPREVLVKVHTAGVNPLDNMIVRGEVRMIVDYRTPLIMGNEFVGTIEKLGADARGFTVGERVYGRMPLSKIGAFAEYAAVDVCAIARVPAYLSDEEAACVPLTACTALQALDLMQPRAGQTIFISGGTGSLGAMAIPVAKSHGPTVVTNGSAAGRDRVLGLGADRFIDYRTEDYAEVLSDVDLVLDTLGDRELAREFAILKRGGTLVSLRGMPNGEFAKRCGMSALKRALFTLTGYRLDRMAAKRDQRYRFVFVHEDGTGLQRISDIFADHRIEASVDEVFSLEDVNEALRKVDAGRSRGKTVLRIAR